MSGGMRTTALIAAGAVLGAAWLGAGPVHAGTFSSAGETLGVDAVTHPLGYDGTGGTLTVSVCLDPSTQDAVVVSTIFAAAVATWNGRQAAADNIVTDAGVGLTEIDFESMALRGLGLCLGLDDPSDIDGYTSATDGENDVLNRNDGVDDVRGTSDDLRGDDQNLMWFSLLDNNPFTSGATFDGTTYSRDTAVLPEGETYATTPTRAVAAALGAGDTEAVMVASLAPGEAKRELSVDDVATLRFAESGLDEMAGTSDDYQVVLDYLGLGDSCDVAVSFAVQAEPVACIGPSQQIAANHYRLAFASMSFSSQVNWHFQGVIFGDDFEAGDASAWTATVP